MSDANYELAPGKPDIRGWDVVLGNNETIGEVDDLIIEPAAGKVRYLDVGLDREAAGLERSRHVLVPIASAHLDAKDKHVLLSGMSRAALLKLPDYDGKTFAGETFAGRADESARSHVTEDFKTRPITRAAEELRIGKRMEKKGEVRVSKHVETDHVKQSVPLQREEVHIERRPVERAVGSAAELRNDEIVVPVMEEEAVVEKRLVVKEEIVISKAPVTTQRIIETDVRREEVDVKPSSGDIRVKDGMRGRGGE